MFERQKLKFASILYNYAFPVYRRLYFRFKNKKDKHHLSIIRKLLKPGDTVLDIGGNIGFFTRFLAGCVGPNGRVYSFEPDKINFGHLQRELQDFPNVRLIQKAVAGQSGSVTLYTSDLLNVDHRTYEPENYSSKYSVEKISVDDFVSGEFKVDFIKLDIQGFEMEALRGMEKTLQANQHITLFTELWPFGLEKAGSSAVEVFDFLTQIGFNIYKIDENRYSRLNLTEVSTLKVEFLNDINILAARAEFIK